MKVSIEKIADCRCDDDLDADAFRVGEIMILTKKFDPSMSAIVGDVMVRSTDGVVYLVDRGGGRFITGNSRISYRFRRLRSDERVVITN